MNCSCLKLVVVCLVFAGMSRVTSYNILMSTLSSLSHKLVFDAIAEELIQRGHQVTMLTSVSGSKKIKGVTEVIVKETQQKLLDSVKHLNIYNDDGGSNSPPKLKTATFHSNSSLIIVLSEMVNITYANEVIKDIINNPFDSSGAHPKYDLVISDANINDFSLPLAFLMGVPSFFVTTFSLTPLIAWSLDIPYPYAYLTNTISPTAGPRNFYERIRNLLNILEFLYYRHFHYLLTVDQVLGNYLRGRPIPSMYELEKNVSFVVINTHPAVHSSTPSMPYSASVGCLQCKPAKPLPNDIEDFMQSSGSHGVVYFSFGTIAQGGLMPEKLKNKFIEAFARLPQNIIWKYKDVNSTKNTSLHEKISKNVKLVPFAPQQDILGHPKTKVFVTHGGGLSMIEAAYHGVPLLGIPLMFDQFCNMAHAESKGFAKLLDIGSFTVDELVNKIQELISEKRYEEKADWLSKVLTDNPIKPVAAAAYHIEYVIRHRGASFLKSGAGNLNFLQYFLLDIIALAMLLFFVACVVIYLMVKALLRLRNMEANELKKLKLL